MHSQSRLSMDPQIAYLLSTVSNRFRRLRFARLLTAGWILVAVVALCLAQSNALPKFSRSILLVVLGGVVGLWLACKLAYRDLRWIANRIETQFPTLKQRLVTAIQPMQASTSRYLRKALVDETIEHARSNDWQQTVATRSLIGAWAVQYMAMALALFTCFSVYSSLANRRDLIPTGPNKLMSDSDQIKVEPGDAEVERGSDLVVSVRFAGQVPNEAWIDSECKTGDKARHSMQRSLKDPLFGGYLRNLQIDSSYRIDYLTGMSSRFQIKVFEFPCLTQSDAKMESPEYAKLTVKEIADTRRVSVVDGANLTWKCQLNKPVSIAELIDQDGVATPLVASKDDPLRFEANFVMTESRKWKLRLVDKENRAAKFEEELSAKVIPNQPPETKLVKAQDQSVSPLQELEMKATVKDDFGVQRSGLTFMLGDAEPTEIVLPVNETKPGKAELSHLIDLELLQAKPDQLLSYYFWAEDIDRDGEVRRVDGDMFFAEVRPFEEVFREGESPSKEQQRQQQQQQQSEGEKKAEDLAELQKQIITGAWNVIRREKPKAISKSFAEDVKLLADSQSEAIGMTNKLAESIEDQQSVKFLEQVRVAMNAAKELFEKASNDSEIVPLRSALRKGREAYEGLLRLRAREHQIVQAQQQQQQKSQQNSSQKNRQQQIDQLKLEDNENRYETEQKADTAEPSAERETRQVMNRLAELAKRQEDLNEQIKSVETALQEAKTEEAKKELEDQVKRLRENQEELLRDSDEVLERMNQPENRESMQEAREQMEQARSDMQKSAESLAKSETSPAISSGTRAQRQMDETKDQMRQSSSSQLEQTMRDMVQDAKRLEEQQKKLEEKLATSNQPTSAASTDEEISGPVDESASPLRPDGDTPKEPTTRKDWQAQKKELKELLEKMQATVSEAESSEPLLAEKLYDSFRESKQKGLEQRMDEIPVYVERGLEEQARRSASELNQGIRNLKENIEKASEDVLGSEEQSLRRALKELERAERQLDAELEKRDPTGKGPREGVPSADEQNQEQSGQQREGQQQPGQQQPGQQQPGQQQPGQQQPGQQQPGQQQPGQQQPGQDRQRGGEPSNLGNRNAGPLQRMPPGGVDYGPLTGTEYSNWVDSLRDVEELVTDPEMKGEVKRIREAAREVRVDYKRHSREPQWSLVRELIANPIEQLREKVQEELLRKSSERSSIVPIDHDPVPSKYQQQQDRYYENLGGAKSR
ncbi:MAG: hypothetical protein NTY15_04615 [Planctomycetota bacterium]|nr:hypothetical protein [Planctomycetota bacterium]